MDKLNKLFKIAEEHGIVVEYIRLHKTIYGVYYKEDGLIPAIGINKLIMNDIRTLTCVLAEELGHHFTTIGDTTAECFCYVDRILLNKNELNALKWAAKTLISPDEMISVISSSNNNYECAQALGVTEKFLIDSIDIFIKSNLLDPNMHRHIFF